MAAMDERLKWLEGRISSSLRPRNEELKNMFLNDENRFVNIPLQFPNPGIT